MTEVISISNASDLEEVIKFKDLNSNYFLSSKVPESCKIGECILGIDEAGRGPVLGPMVYGICYCPKNCEQILKDTGCADSKTLTEESRETIFEKLCGFSESIGWEIEAISPVTISNSMLRRNKISLNELSHNSAIGLVKRALECGVNVTEVYVDTVGPADKYQDKLQSIFPKIKVTVSKKADSLFPIVSAASICAKVSRDVCLRVWRFPELDEKEEGYKYGSGYPNDPVTKTFLTENMDKIFGFPQLVRFSWSTAEKILDDQGVTADWEDDTSDAKSTPSVKSFFNKGGEDVDRHRFFKERNLSNVTKL